MRMRGRDSKGVWGGHVHTAIFKSEVKVKATQSCPTLCDPMNYTVHGILQARMLEWVTISFSRGSSNPGIKLQFPALQADFLPGEPSGKPKNTGVGSLSLFQGIFPIQELTRVSCIASGFFTSMYLK